MRICGSVFNQYAFLLQSFTLPYNSKYNNILHWHNTKTFGFANKAWEERKLVNLPFSQCYFGVSIVLTTLRLTIKNNQTWSLKMQLISLKCQCDVDLTMDVDLTTGDDVMIDASWCWWLHWMFYCLQFIYIIHHYLCHYGPKR